ncbi:MAG: HAD-IA family hydrolase [Gammaproteobacteria bacterium]|nr:HAD-IA family hydrolase [Gammaproteobacteria bacterium]
METLSTSIQCVLFDLDGTLIDTAADFQQVLNILMDKEGRQRVPSERINQTVSDGARALVKLAFEIDEDHADFGRYLEQLLDLYYEQLQHTVARPYPGVLELLEKLEASNILWGIVTNKPEKYTRLLLEKLDLLQRCGTLVCPEHVSARKPNPEPLLLACKQLDCDTERTVYIGDHIRDMQAAKNAEIIAIAAQYGYLAPDTSIDQWNADFIIKSAGDTENLLSILKFT